MDERQHSGVTGGSATETINPSADAETHKCGQKGENLADKRRWKEWKDRLGGAVVGIVVFLGLTIGFAYWMFGSLAIGLAYLRGERLIIFPQAITVEELHRGEERQLSIWLVNHTGKEVHIVGGGANCSCVVLDRFPMTVPDGARQELKVILRGVGKAGSFRQVVQYFTDDEESPILLVYFAGHLRENTGSP
jgi:hypothetical protein